MDDRTAFDTRGRDWALELRMRALRQHALVLAAVACGLCSPQFVLSSGVLSTSGVLCTQPVEWPNTIPHLCTDSEQGQLPSLPASWDAGGCQWGVDEGVWDASSCEAPDGPACCEVRNASWAEPHLTYEPTTQAPGPARLMVFLPGTGGAPNEYGPPTPTPPPTTSHRPPTTTNRPTPAQPSSGQPSPAQPWPDLTQHSYHQRTSPTPPLNQPRLAH